MSAHWSLTERGHFARRIAEQKNGGSSLQRLIDKRCVIKHLKELLKNSIMPTEWYEGAKYAITLLQKEPTVDAEPVRHGHWIEGNNFHWYSNSCSCCGYTRTTDIKSNGWNQWKYCPNCGAEMDEVRNG